ncbi:hypothetical protein AM587_10002785 [Phytophthora nicotianae]|uniref:Uncharacterized protein n=1 Tax=Phytophthora nicotianae TaxID=4792 RepID=A0A0W8E126_PHYNI|nr:hypothetical protein AM587_10002785 [Phytophthora nicotianae]
MEELELRMLQWGIRDGAGAADDEDDAAESDSSGGGEVIYQLNLPSKGRRSTYLNELKLRVVEEVRAGGKVAAVAASNDVHTRTAFGSSECAAHRFRGRKKAKAASHFPRPARRHN